MRGIFVLLFGVYLGSVPYALARSCDLACSDDEARIIADDLHQQFSGKSCIIEAKDEKNLEKMRFDRSPEWGARIVKYRYARSCDPEMPVSDDLKKQSELKDFLTLTYEAVGINYQRKDFNKVCFTEHSILDLRPGDILQMGNQEIVIDRVGKELSTFNRSMQCEDLVSDPTRLNVGVIYLTMENGIRDIVRGHLSPAMGNESANNPWVTRILDAAQKACLIKQHKRTPASVSQSMDKDLVVKRFNPDKPGCLKDDYAPFRIEGGSCAKCCLLRSAEVRP